MRIVVLGGTFAPPTFAHLELMRSAMHSVQADAGIIVPAPLKYVNEWKSEVAAEERFLSDSIRIRMLNAMIENDKDILIDTRELDDPGHAYTYLTMRYLKEKYGTDDLFFIMGSDKLTDLCRWYNSEKLLEEYRFLVVARNNDDLSAMIKGSEFLTRHKDKLAFLPAGRGCSHISSTAVRQLIHEGNFTEAAKYVPEKVMEIIRKEVI